MCIRDSSYWLPEWYSIELAQASDAKDIEKVRRETWKTTYIDDWLSVEEIDAKFDESDEKNIQRITKGIQEWKKYYVLKYQWDIVWIKYNPWFDENRNIHRIGWIYIEENHQGKGLWAHLMDISLQWLQSVSYTHLDVYKRQLLLCIMTLSQTTC